MRTVVIEVRGVEYHLDEKVWTLARRTFEQQYPTWKREKRKVVDLARMIAADLMPASFDDPWSQERLTRCLLSHFGRKGGKKKGSQASLPRVTGQLVLFEE